jgi:high affinity sulfate transporter 1
MWLPRYEYRRDLRFDLIAGATLWGLLVPEMIAYAGLAGLPPQAGLYTLLATLAAYAVFGTSRHVVVAGTSAAAVLLASTVGEVAVGQDDYLANAAALVLFVGGLSLLAGVCRLGFIAQFLSRPVVEGFVFGLAIFVTVKQLPKLFGISGGEGDTFRQLGHVIAHLGDTNGPTLVIGAAALALLFGLERFAANVPGGLVALVLGIVVSGAFDLSTHGVAIVGKVPSGFPSVSVPSFASENVPTLIAAAGGMLLVIFSESLGAAQNFATKHGYEIDPNQELIALGVANAGSGFVGGLAAGGSLSQSAVNEGAGARSEVSPLVAALLMVVTVLVLMPVFKNLPEAVLAALIIHAVSHLWKVEEFRRYYGVRRIEFLLGLATLLGVITIDVLPGLIIGVVSMLVLVIYRASRPHLSVLGRVAGVPGAYGDIGRHPDYEQVPDLRAARAPDRGTPRRRHPPRAGRPAPAGAGTNTPERPAGPDRPRTRLSHGRRSRASRSRTFGTHDDVGGVAGASIYVSAGTGRAAGGGNADARLFADASRIFALHRRGARSGGRHRRAGPVADPARSQRRVGWFGPRGLDARLRRDLDRRVIAPARAHLAAGRGSHDRHLGVRARAHFAAADQPLRQLVRRSSTRGAAPMESVPASTHRWRKPK